MLLYDGVLQQVIGTPSFMTPQEQSRFEQLARHVGIPYRRSESALEFKLKAVE
jgi:hypothetical protein